MTILQEEKNKYLLFSQFAKSLNIQLTKSNLQTESKGSTMWFDGNPESFSSYATNQDDIITKKISLSGP